MEERGNVYRDDCGKGGNKGETGGNSRSFHPFALKFTGQLGGSMVMKLVYITHGRKVYFLQEEP
jgi:hypothetical protein